LRKFPTTGKFLPQSQFLLENAKSQKRATSFKWTTFNANNFHFAETIIYWLISQILLCLTAQRRMFFPKKISLNMASDLLALFSGNNILKDLWEMPPI